MSKSSLLSPSSLPPLSLSSLPPLSLLSPSSLPPLSLHSPLGNQMLLQGSYDVRFSLCVRLYSIMVRNCCSWGWLSVTFLPALMAVSISPFTTMFVTARRLERSMFL